MLVPVSFRTCDKRNHASATQIENIFHDSTNGLIRRSYNKRKPKIHIFEPSYSRSTKEKGIETQYEGSKTDQETVQKETVDGTKSERNFLRKFLIGTETIETFETQYELIQRIEIEQSRKIEKKFQIHTTRYLKRDEKGSTS